MSLCKTVSLVSQALYSRKESRTDGLLSEASTHNKTATFSVQCCEANPHIQRLYSY